MSEIEKFEDDSINEEKSEKIGKITVIDDGRFIITTNTTPPLHSGFIGSKIRGDYITRNQLSKTLNKYRKKLLTLDLNDKKCVMITLTLDPSKNIKIREFERYIGNFLKLLRKYFNDFEYIKRIEGNKFEDLFHVHILLFFDNIPDLLTNE